MPKGAQPLSSVQMREFIGIGLALAFAFTLVTRVDAQVPIPVVHTWGDLQKAPKLTVLPSVKQNATDSAPITFQVGIQSDKAASYGGLVFYFLELNSHYLRSTPEERGLYSLKVTSKLAVAVQYDPSQQEAILETGNTFYAETITFEAAGEYSVELFHQNPGETRQKLLARAMVQVQDHPQDLWFPWWPREDSSNAANTAEQTGGSDFSLIQVANPPGASAVPRTPGPRSYSKLPPLEQSLPVLVSDLVDNPHVHLTMTDSALIVMVDQPYERSVSDDNFLTHWWVNDKQIELNPTLPTLNQARSLLASRPGLKLEIHFQLSFKPERLGAKKGDRIGVQLLFCPDGWLPTNQQSLIYKQAVEEPLPQPAPTCFSETSNRIDFIYSGDPQHPQKTP